ncbi:hypothetical protein PENSUB_5165 [Penicillium subrubescens]|uniref:Uncharacterized protein n=1 Tax=Penicillium subrubescens TaxID=1316194 RepID=A0A1Q5UAJ4_9EURO|nr:hypothetical protein PENSUB_5165 [Penicillium subrubescens]
MVAPGLGTYANPIVIGDDLAPLGSASNPIVIQVDEGWCQDEPDQLGSDADTEIMATPEFWGTLTAGHLAVPVKDDVALDSSSVRVPTRSLVCEDPEGFQPFGRSSPNGFQSEKALKITKHSFDALRECPGFGATRRENVASDHRENTLPSNSNRSKQLQGQSEEGRVTMRFYAPDFQKGATWPTNLLVNQVIIRTAFSPDIPCSLEIFKQDDILFGRGAVVVPMEGKDPKCFLTFSPKARQDDHGTNVRASRKRADGIVILESVVPEREKGANWRYGFTGQVSVEIYKRWPPLASDYEEREVFFGSIALIIHSDGVDPKCFLTFSQGLSSADRKPYSPAPDNNVHNALLVLKNHLSSVGSLLPSLGGRRKPFWVVAAMRNLEHEAVNMTPPHAI